MEGSTMEYIAEFNNTMKVFENGVVFSLATEIANQPSVRLVCGFALDGIIYFQTDCSMDKVKEIYSNPNVALCTECIQIFGKCIECGSPIDSNNQWFSQKYKQLFPQSYKKYSSLPNERIFGITPVLIKKWDTEDKVPRIIQIDIQNESLSMRYFKEYIT